MKSRIVAWFLILPLYILAGAGLFFHYEGGAVLSYSKSTVILEGHEITLVREYEKARNCKTVSANHVLEKRNGEDVIVDARFGSPILNSKIGRRTILQMRGFIPANLPPGQYHVRSDISFKCNPVQWRTHHIKSKPFVVK